jgi:uncharacterized damage-inducible protein DinB
MPLSLSIVTRLEYQYKSLFEVIDDMSDEKIRRNIIPGKWSIFENIVHLQTYQHAFLARINQIENEDKPTFSRYVAESDPLFYDNCLKTTRDIFQDLESTRKTLHAQLLNLEENSLQLTGTHPVFGTMNISQWTNFFLLHEAHHLFTIFKLAAEVKRESRSGSISL